MEKFCTQDMWDWGKLFVLLERSYSTKPWTVVYPRLDIHHFNFRMPVVGLNVPLHMRYSYTGRLLTQSVFIQCDRGLQWYGNNRFCFATTSHDTSSPGEVNRSRFGSRAKSMSFLGALMSLPSSPESHLAYVVMSSTQDLFSFDINEVRKERLGF